MRKNTPTGGIHKKQLMFTSRAQLRMVIATENIWLEIGKVDGFGIDPTHPAPRADLVSDEGCPDRFSDHDM